MKTGFVIVALTIGLIAGSMPGSSPASERRLAGMADMNSSDPGPAAGDSRQTPGPIETGAPPPTSDSMSMADGMASGDEGVTRIETGGVNHRVGLDTGP